MLNRIQMLAIRLRHDESGQTFVEYGLIVGVVVVSFAVVFAGLAGALGGVVDAIDDLLPNAD
jgi:Flp pilus assembly pilin Flp